MTLTFKSCSVKYDCKFSNNELKYLKTPPIP